MLQTHQNTQRGTKIAKTHPNGHSAGTIHHRQAPQTQGGSRDTQSASETSKTFYISNLAEKTTKEDLHHFLQKYGAVTSLDVATLPDGACKGHAKATLKFSTTPNYLTRRLVNTKEEINGTLPRVELFIDQKDALTFRDSCLVQRRICVLNIPPRGFSDRKFRAVFEHFFGAVHGAYVRRTKANKRSGGKNGASMGSEGSQEGFNSPGNGKDQLERGGRKRGYQKKKHDTLFGFVTFESLESVGKALEAGKLILRAEEWSEEGYQGAGNPPVYGVDHNDADNSAGLGPAGGFVVLEIKPFKSKNNQKGRQGKNFQKVKNSPKSERVGVVGADRDSRGSNMIQGPCFEGCMGLQGNLMMAMMAGASGPYTPIFDQYGAFEHQAMLQGWPQSQFMAQNASNYAQILPNSCYHNLADFGGFGQQSPQNYQDYVQSCLKGHQTPLQTPQTSQFSPYLPKGQKTENWPKEWSQGHNQSSGAPSRPLSGSGRSKQQSATQADARIKFKPNLDFRPKNDQKMSLAEVFEQEQVYGRVLRNHSEFNIAVNRRKRPYLKYGKYIRF